jgi:hypothetical protein
MMCKKRNETTTVDKELYFIEVDDAESLVPDAKEEMGRMFILWDAVLFSLCLHSLIVNSLSPP